jgi:hypothetical protein
VKRSHIDTHRSQGKDYLPGSQMGFVHTENTYGSHFVGRFRRRRNYAQYCNVGEMTAFGLSIIGHTVKIIS